MKKVLKFAFTAAVTAVFLTACTWVFAASPAPSAEPAAVAATAAVTSEPVIAASPAPSAEPATAEPATETAAATAAATETAAKYSADTLDFHIVIDRKKYVTDSFIKLEVYDSDGNFLASDREWVGGITESVDLHYDVPEYTLGESFTVKLVEGAKSVSYYEKTVTPGESFTVTTNYYTDDNGNFVEGNTFVFNAVPNWEKEIIVYVDDEQLTLKPRARLINEITYVPVRAVAEAMKISVKYDGNYDSVVCSVGSDEIIYNMGSNYATFFGEDTYLQGAAMYLQNTAYVPVRSLAEAFDASIEALDFGDHMDIVIGESEKVKTFLKNSPVNSRGIDSRTSYLVWVSKSEYTVRVYTGSRYNWTLAYTAPCAIGAPGTPTVTGSFEYLERTQWNYNGYYVGPVLRFYNGYALHSTLLYYGGGEYDGRVGVQISHGCVRLHPQDINWIAARIPPGTRIYITE